MEKRITIYIYTEIRTNRSGEVTEEYRKYFFDKEKAVDEAIKDYVRNKVLKKKDNERYVQKFTFLTEMNEEWKGDAIDFITAVFNEKFDIKHESGEYDTIDFLNNFEPWWEEDVWDNQWFNENNKIIESIRERIEYDDYDEFENEMQNNIANDAWYWFMHEVIYEKKICKIKENDINEYLNRRKEIDKITYQKDPSDFEKAIDILKNIINEESNGKWI